MSILILAAMMMDQASAATAQAPTAKKQKPQQVCQMMQITGSRARERVCHEVGEATDLKQFGVSDSAFGKGTFQNADPKVAGPPK
jgi:hypothetical protein